MSRPPCGIWCRSWRRRSAPRRVTALDPRRRGAARRSTNSAATQRPADVTAAAPSAAHAARRLSGDARPAARGRGSPVVPLDVRRRGGAEQGVQARRPRSRVRRRGAGAHDVSHGALARRAAAPAAGRRLQPQPASASRLRRARRPRSRREGCAARRVGVRAYTTTTAVWIRAMLADQFGVRLDASNGSRSRKGTSPACRIRPGRNARLPGSDLMAMLRDGRHRCRHRRSRFRPATAFVPVVPDPEAACRDWQHRHGARTLNHVIVVRESLAEDERGDARAVRALPDSRELAGAAVDRAATPLGLGGESPESRGRDRRRGGAGPAGAAAHGRRSRHRCVATLQ